MTLKISSDGVIGFVSKPALKRVAMEAPFRLAEKYVDLSAIFLEALEVIQSYKETSNREKAEEFLNKHRVENSEFITKRGRC